MKKNTKRIAIPVVTVLAAGALTGALLIGNTAGADPLPGDPSPVALPDVPADGGFVEPDVQAWAAGVGDAIAALDGGKKNEDGLRSISDQEDVVTDADGKVRLCFNAAKVHAGEGDYADTFAEPSGLFAGGGLVACPNGTISLPGKHDHTNVEIRGLLDDDGQPVAGDTPTTAQVAHHVGDGAILTFLNADGEATPNVRVRFTYVATASVE